MKSTTVRLDDTTLRLFTSTLTKRKPLLVRSSPAPAEPLLPCGCSTCGWTHWSLMWSKGEGPERARPGPLLHPATSATGLRPALRGETRPSLPPMLASSDRGNALERPYLAKKSRNLRDLLDVRMRETSWSTRRSRSNPLTKRKPLLVRSGPAPDGRRGRTLPGAPSARCHSMISVSEFTFVSYPDRRRPRTPVRALPAPPRALPGLAVQREEAPRRSARR